MVMIYIFLCTGFESIKSIFNDYNHKGRDKISGTGVRPSGLEIWTECTVDRYFLKIGNNSGTLHSEWRDSI